MAHYCLAIDQALSNAAQGAFLPTRERDLYYLDPAPTVFGDLDPSYQGLIFPDSGLEAPDLESIMGDSVPDDIKSRVLIAARESHARNQEKVQTLDFKIRLKPEGVEGEGERSKSFSPHHTSSCLYTASNLYTSSCFAVCSLPLNGLQASI